MTLKVIFVYSVILQLSLLYVDLRDLINTDAIVVDTVAAPTVHTHAFPG